MPMNEDQKHKKNTVDAKMLASKKETNRTVWLDDVLWSNIGVSCKHLHCISLTQTWKVFLGPNFLAWLTQTKSTWTVIGYLACWELRCYPPSKALVKKMFLLLSWDMFVSWRIYIGSYFLIHSPIYPSSPQPFPPPELSWEGQTWQVWWMWRELSSRASLRIPRYDTPKKCRSLNIREVMQMTCRLNCYSPQVPIETLYLYMHITFFCVNMNTH